MNCMAILKAKHKNEKKYKNVLNLNETANNHFFTLAIKVVIAFENKSEHALVQTYSNDPRKSESISTNG